MPNFVRIGAVEDFPEGQGRIISAARKPVAVFKAGGKFYAVNNICPHMGGPIGEGRLRGYLVDCPWHGWSYDIRNGKDPTPPGHDISAYEVKVEGDVISVGWIKEA